MSNEQMSDGRKYKRSRQRERILQTLQGTKSHPTAAWVYDKLKHEFPNLSLGTVYRNLNILQEQGLLRVLQSGSTFDRFDADISEHYHFVCDQCGAVLDVPIPVDARLDAIASESLGVEIRGHRLDFHGVCGPCAAGESGKVAS